MKVLIVEYIIIITMTVAGAVWMDSQINALVAASRLQTAPVSSQSVTEPITASGDSPTDALQTASGINVFQRADGRVQ